MQVYIVCIYINVCKCAYIVCLYIIIMYIIQLLVMKKNNSNNFKCDQFCFVHFQKIKVLKSTMIFTLIIFLNNNMHLK
jgi:hypothetical protein